MSTAHTIYDIYAQPDGTAVVHTWTNDNLDLGYASETESWDSAYPSVAAARKVTGGTRFGMHGHQVDVHLNGTLIDAEGNEISLEDRSGDSDGWQWGTDSDE